MRSRIIEAIQNKKILEFRYDGQDRIVEPYILGLFRGAAGGTLMAFQIGGGSNSGGIPDWRNFDLKKIFKLAVTKRTFLDPQPSYNPDDKRFLKIFAQI